MLSFGDTTVDDQGHEIIEDGTIDFPIACYFDDLERKTIPWHWHEEVEIGIVREGTIIIHTPDSQCRFVRGEAFYINSNMLHMIEKHNSEKCSIDSLVFHANLAGGSIDSVFWRKYIRPVISNPGITTLSFNEQHQSQVVDLIKSAWIQCVHSDYGFEIHVRYFLSQLFAVINQEHYDISTADQKKISRHNERLKIMLTYIKEHFSENITVQKIADSAAISESECLRCFRTVLGSTPIAYLKKYRLQHATELLDSTELKISYIGQQCGFSEMSYFSKSFKEVYQCTPSEYRLQK